MRRRDLIRTLSAGVVASSLPSTVSAQREQGDRPNILWITCEDMSANLGCWGDAYSRTPNIDRLASQSVRYTNAYATAPVCSPARSCLITGVYATSLGTQNLRSAFPIPEYMRGFPSYLRDAGYFCTNNVKTDYNTSREPAIIAASWDECSGEAHWRHRQPRQPFFSVFNDMTTHQSRSMVWPYERFQREVQGRLSAEERHDAAEAPLPPYYPDTAITRRTVARYYDCITAMDKNVGTILEQLEHDGLAENTVVFFFSDHGAGMPRHKRLVLDSGLHVPLLIRFPRKYRHLAPAGAGETVGRLVSFVDFPPTVLSIAGLAIPDYMQGVAFLGPAAAAPRDYVYGARDRVDEAYDLARSVRDKRYLYVRNYMRHLSYNQPSSYSDQGEIRQQITRLAEEGKLSGPQLHYAGPSRPVEELYDSENDPHQVRNLADSPDHRAILERMRAVHRRWVVATHDTGFLPEAEMWQRSQGSTPYEMAQRPAQYPQQRTAKAADLVGRGPEALSRQIELLQDPDGAVRYWAAVGLRALGRPAAAAEQALERALDDSSPSVRVQAAAALANLGRTDGALRTLTAELRSEQGDVVLHAARALELMGEQARPAIAAMQASLESEAAKAEPLGMFIRFSLNAALKKLGTPARGPERP